MKQVTVIALASCVFCLADTAGAQDGSYTGLTSSLENIYRVAKAKTYSISPENLTGEKGKGGMAAQGSASNAAAELGQGWKVNPYIVIQPGQTFTLGEIQGSGAVQHIWMTPTGNWRFSILRMYWDDEATPSVECPVGDFFAMGWANTLRSPRRRSPSIRVAHSIRIGRCRSARKRSSRWRIWTSGLL